MKSSMMWKFSCGFSSNALHTIDDIKIAMTNNLRQLKVSWKPQFLTIARKVLLEQFLPSISKIERGSSIIGA